MLDELRGAGLLDLVDDPPALATNPAATDVEDLNGGLELVLRERHHVGVRAVTQHDRLLLHRPVQRADVVAQAGRALVFLGG